MQPNAPTRPVMDVAAPKSPAPAAVNQPVAVAPVSAPTPMPTPSTVPVQPAPFTASTPQPAVAPAIERRPSGHRAGAAALPQHRAPVALITVTIFVMLVLSALAVTVYVTSQTA